MTRVLIEVTEVARYVVEVDAASLATEDLHHAWVQHPPVYPAEIIGTEITVVDDGTTVATSALDALRNHVEDAMLVAEGALAGIEDKHSPEAHVHQGYIAALGAVSALIEKRVNDVAHA